MAAVRRWRRAACSRALHVNSSAFAPLETQQTSSYVQSPAGADVVNLALGQPSPALLPLELLGGAAAHRFRPAQDRMLLQYGAAKGFVGFRESIAAFVSEPQDGEVDAEQIMVTAGNSQAISHAAMAFTKTNKRVFVEEPTYFLAHDIFRELGLELSGLPVDGHGLDVDALEDRLASGDVPAFVYTIPFFHNPTGAVLPQERCSRLVALAQKYGFHVISDEPYNFLHLEGPPLPSLASFDDSGFVVSLGSFSKILAPGLRLGWAQSTKETLQTLSTIGALRSGGGQNPITSSLVHSVLELGELHPHIDRLKATFRSRKAVLCGALREHCPDVSFMEPSGGYFVWIQLPAGIDAEALLAEAQASHGVAFTPGSRCSLGPKAQKAQRHGNVPISRHARLSFAFYNEEELVEGVERFRRALDALVA